MKKKLFNFRNILLIFLVVGMLHSMKSEVLQCTFKNDDDLACDCRLYGCFATLIEYEEKDKVFDNYTGIHHDGNNGGDVKHLSIRDSDISYLPKQLNSLFNLTSLLVVRSSLISIQYEDFIGLENLEYLHLGDNYLKFIPDDAFYKLPQLKHLTLRDNLIEELSRKVFKNNNQLEMLWLYGNNIKTIGYHIFFHLKKLNFVDLSSNKCISKKYDNFESMFNLKRDLKSCYKGFEPKEYYKI